MWIEFSMGDFERIFYAFSFYYINFLLFFHFHKKNYRIKCLFNIFDHSETFDFF